MTDLELQALVEHISGTVFELPFKHEATFNSRLRTSGGRYVLATHHIEMNPHHLRVNGMEAFVQSIKHELCHYHLHLSGRGYRHQDPDFKNLLRHVGGSRYCPDTGLRRTIRRRYTYRCRTCHAKIVRQRRMNTHRFVCATCHGRLTLESFVENTP